MRPPDETVCQVAVGVVSDPLDRILLTRRARHAPQGGLWEFPGGKVARGEAGRAALFRELHEELGIAVQIARPLIRLHHAYSDQTVLLDVWRVTAFRGQAYGREGQPLAWLDQDQLVGRDFPAANRPIVTAVRLPSVYCITPEPENRADFLRGVARWVEAGAPLVQLRAPRLDGRAYRDLASAVLSLCRGTGTALMLNAAPSLAVELGAAGVHLNGARLRASASRPLGREFWVAASCHDARELAHAQAIGADFAVVSPVGPTARHPGAPALGWAGLRALTERAALPVYALGGLRPEHRDRAYAHGAQGIAAVTALWDEARTPAAWAAVFDRRA